jgi:hypothetical protein
MLTKLVLGITLLPVLFSAGPSHQSSANLRREPGYMPVGTVSPEVAYSNETIPVQVILNGTPTSDETVTISTSAPAMFASLPSSVVVAAGTSTVTFYATLSSSAGSVQITSSACNYSSSSTTHVEISGEGSYAGNSALKNKLVRLRK